MSGSPRTPEGEALPLRLSVARGGLGLELGAPVAFGPLIVEELEVALPGVSYPVDLSKGVKHFRNRRSALRHALVRVDLDQLGRAWQQVLRDTWGPEVRVRLRPVSSGEDAPGTNDAVRTSSIAVSVHSGDSALAFDLVISSGTEPRIVVDTPRMFGREESSLLVAVQALDVGLSAAMESALTLSRRGRALELSGLCETIALLVLPELGCRLPSVAGQVVTDVRAEARGLVIAVGPRDKPFSSGRRGLRVAGVAEFLRRADDALIHGDFATARSEYLEALEQAPGHEEALFELSELDLSVHERAEAALSFVEELEGVVATERTRQVSARLGMVAARALDKTARTQAAREALISAAEAETDAPLAALLLLEISKRHSGTEAREFLDRAVGRAPFVTAAREARFRFALRGGDVKTARADAEQIEASRGDDHSRARACLDIGQEFRGAGFDDQAQHWLRRALRLDPDDVTIMVAVAASLRDSGEAHRAAEMFQAALRVLSSRIEAYDTLDQPRLDISASSLEERQHLSAECRLEIARILEDEGAEVAQILSYLAPVETRSPFGLEARLMEASIYHSSGRGDRRDRCLMRLLEAVEMGWVKLGSTVSRLRTLLAASAEDQGDPALLEFATRVLENDQN